MMFSRDRSCSRDSSGRPCPDCGESLDDDGDGRYECHNDACRGWGVYFDVDGDLLDPDARNAIDRPERRCIGCDWPLSSDSVFTAEWEDGDNSYAYITCSRCRAENIF